MLQKFGKRILCCKQKRLFCSTILNGTSRTFIDQQYIKWRKDRTSVQKSWDGYFSEFESSPDYKASQTFDESKSEMDNYLKIDNMVQHFRYFGHKVAKLDPLKLQKDEEIKKLANFDLSKFGLNNVKIPSMLKTRSNSILFNNERIQNTDQLRRHLKLVYCDSVGYETAHIQNEREREWLYRKIESGIFVDFEKNDKIEIFETITRSCKFEKFLSKKWPVQKRFGLEGLESMIPGIKAVIETSSNLGVENFVLGMPHRGRLNVLVNVLEKSPEQIFTEFNGGKAWKRLHRMHSGDVKYHSGHSCDLLTNFGKKVHISLVANPSHLEACNTVVLGKTRAKQEFGGDGDLAKSMGFLIHGDAAFYGQGIVYETLMMSGFKGYETGGVMHIICNNQIGYTTDPLDTRKARYCSDVAKSFGAPIFHVNAENLEGVVSACKLAAEYRNKFKKDVVVDIIGYRKYGHNEGDEPRFTQPYMYSKIDNKKNQMEIYKKQLLAEKAMNEEEIKNVETAVETSLEDSFRKSKKLDPAEVDWMDHRWTGYHGIEKYSYLRTTGMDIEVLRKIGFESIFVPEGFKVHERLAKFLELRKVALSSGEGIDWGLAEAMALGSLAKENCKIRLSGQDVERGTFSHRHAILLDQKKITPQKFCYPLQNIQNANSSVRVVNSPLSEYGVLGFEYGFSIESPNSLVLWEAQFGDFANNAQVIFDQFISCAENKWLRQSGLVVLLPHGYEGGGPEHSNARIDRFLQMCDEHPDHITETDSERSIRVQNCNWQIVNCSTPANYFHVLRRQFHRSFRKPLIVFSPKSLLKLRECKSSFQDFKENTKFKWLLEEREELVEDDKVKKLILCSGKVYFDLVKERSRLRIKNVAIVTLEQLCPFPFKEVVSQFKRYKNAKISWVQEEPMNMGAYSFVLQRLHAILKSLKQSNIEIAYAGRPPSASSATGFGMKEHAIEMKSFLKKAFD